MAKRNLFKEIKEGFKALEKERKNKHIGSTFDSLLKKEGYLSKVKKGNKKKGIKEPKIFFGIDIESKVPVKGSMLSFFDSLTNSEFSKMVWRDVDCSKSYPSGKPSVQPSDTQKKPDMPGHTESYPHPGSIIREDIIPGLDITAVDLANRLCVPERELEEILNHTKPITALFALRLEKLLGQENGGEFKSWLKMQALYDEAQARKAFLGIDPMIQKFKV